MLLSPLRSARPSLGEKKTKMRLRSAPSCFVSSRKTKGRTRQTDVLLLRPGDLKSVLRLGGGHVNTALSPAFLVNDGVAQGWSR